MILFLQDREFLVILARHYEKCEFLDAARVSPGSYAAQVAEQIYDSLFMYATDVGMEYSTYYADEYPDLATFLYWKYAIDDSEAIQEAEQAAEGAGYVGYGDGLSYFIESEPVMEFLNRVFAQIEESAQ